MLHDLSRILGIISVQPLLVLLCWRMLLHSVEPLDASIHRPKATTLLNAHSQYHHVPDQTQTLEHPIGPSFIQKIDRSTIVFDGWHAAGRPVRQQQKDASRSDCQRIALCEAGHLVETGDMNESMLGLEFFNLFTHTQLSDILIIESWFVHFL